MEFEEIIYTKEEGIATITLNRPQNLNATSPKMIEEWLAAAEDAKRDDEVKVLVITGAGRVFCAGGNVRSMQDWPGEESLVERRRNMFEGFPSMARFLSDFDKPYIAAVNGASIGAGMEIASMCDIRIASEKAIFSMAFVRMGLIPVGGGCYFLPRIMGIARACELIWTGRRINAQEALQIGYVSKVVPPDELQAATKELATQLARGPSVAIGLDKRLIYRCLDLDLDNALEAHISAMLMAQSTEDAIEGPKAYVEKREPIFKGR